MNKLDLINLTIPDSMNIPEWQKVLWIEFVHQNAKEVWPYENIINEYTKLMKINNSLKAENIELKNFGIRNIKLEIEAIEIKKEIAKLKQENESLKNENIDKIELYEKMRLENQNLITSLLNLKGFEAKLQNKIFELESNQNTHQS